MTAQVRIVGCGNPDRGDDAAGLLVVRRLRELDVKAAEECSDVLSLIECWRSADDVTVVDAVLSGALAGTLTLWDVETTLTRLPARENSRGVLICRGVPPWAPYLGQPTNEAGAPTEGYPYRSEQYQTSTHGFGVAQAIELARALNQLPKHLRIYGIEGRQFEIGAPVSPEVLAAVECLAQKLAVTHSGI